MIELEQGSGNSQSSAELKEQIRQTVEDATRAALEGTRDARRGQGFTMVAPNGAGIRDIPPRVEGVAYGFFAMCAVIIIGSPLARAFGRRLERPGQQPALPNNVGDQLVRIEQAVEAMSIEIERIAESQRFMAKLQDAQREQRGNLSAGR